MHSSFYSESKNKVLTIPKTIYFIAFYYFQSVNHETILFFMQIFCRNSYWSYVEWKS